MEVVAAVIVVVFVVLLSVRGDARCREIVSEWAEEEGHDLLGVRRRWLGAPFFLRGREQRVYEVEVRDRNGEVRTGRAKVGGFWFGSLENRIVVRWDW